MQSPCSAASSSTWPQVTAKPRVSVASAYVLVGGTQAKIPSCATSALLYRGHAESPQLAEETNLQQGRLSPKENSPFGSHYVEAHIARKCLCFHPRCKAKSKLPGDQKLNHKIKSFSKVPCRYWAVDTSKTAVASYWGGMGGELQKEVVVQIPWL